ncbi:minor capsid protein [Variovorax paradoxus]|nr:minor capsid protein [Variovorax paradoxus]
MATVNDLLLDAETDHAVNLQQYSAGVVRRIIAILNRSDAQIASALIQALGHVDATSFTVERLEVLLGSVRALNAEAYAAIGRELPQEMRTLAAYEANYQLDLFQATIPQAVQARFPIRAISVEQAYAAALSRPFQGRLLQSWAGAIEPTRMQQIRNTVRDGFLQGKTTGQIIQAVRGTRAKGYSDGILNRGRIEVEAVVRTAVSHTAAAAREEFYQANTDVIASLKWVSTLDTRTSEMCRIRDGKQYSTDHKPVGHSVPWLQGPGRLHWRCRSSSAPITKSFRELGIDIDELAPTERASMDGQVPAEMSYGDWLQKQSAKRQDEVVGPTRGALMRQGKMPFDSFYTARGEWIDLDTLRARDAVAFKRAGL